MFRVAFVGCTAPFRRAMMAQAERHVAPRQKSAATILKVPGVELGPCHAIFIGPEAGDRLERVQHCHRLNGSAMIALLAEEGELTALRDWAMTTAGIPRDLSIEESKDPDWAEEFLRDAVRKAVHLGRLQALNERGKP